MAKRERTELKKGSANFQLLGNAKINPDHAFKIDVESSKSDWVYNQLNIGVDCGNGNTVYAEMMGGYGSKRDNVLYVNGNKKNDEGKVVDDYTNRFTIDWDDRLDEDILDTIGDSKFIKVGIEKDSKGNTFTKRFLSEYDAIAYIAEHLEDGQTVNVKGSIEYSMYEDTVQMRKKIKSIYLSNKEEKDFGATFTQTLLVDGDSIGKVDKDRNSIPIHGYVVEYIGKVNGEKIGKNVVLPKTFEVPITDKEKTDKVIDKLFKTSRKNPIIEITMEGEIIESMPMVTGTLDDLPEDIRDLVDLGIYSEEEALTKCIGKGKKEKRMILTKPHIRQEGKGEEKTPKIMIDKDKYDEDDLVFYAQVVATSEAEKDDVEEKKVKAKVEDDDDDDDFDLDGLLDELE